MTREKPELVVSPFAIRELSAANWEDWNQAVASLPLGHVLQSFEWGKVKANYSWRPTRLLLEREDKVVAAASVLSRRLPLPGRTIIYVPKGPCFDPSDQASFSQLLGHLKLLAKRSGALFLKIDPDIPIEDTASQATLTAAGFQPSPEQIQYQNTMVIDLRLSEEELRSRMRRETRYYLNVARRNGVEVAEGNIDDLPLFYDIYRETGERNRFLLRPYDYYATLWQTFINHGLAKLWLARYQGESLAGVLVYILGRKMWYLYGASRNAHREVRPNHLLQWEVMCWAKRHGIELYDLWGIPDVLEQGQPMWGVAQFKKGLGGEVRRWIGAYDFVGDPLLYRLWTGLMPRLLKLGRKVLHLPDTTES